MNVSTRLSSLRTTGGAVAATPASGAILKRFSRKVFSSLFWVVLIKAGLATGAALAMAARFVQ